MEYRILGPLEVSKDAEPIPVRGYKRRALLAILLLHRNQVVSADRLVDELWDSDPPPSAGKALRVHVSQLRRDLSDAGLHAGSNPLITRSPGYLLRVLADELDADRFESLASDARRKLQDSPAQALKELDDALGLWKGAALADFSFEEFARPTIERLEEQRLTAVEDRIEAALAMGRHQTEVAELEGLVAGHPLRERLRALLMLALYRSGRQADALRVYQESRTVLSEGLGIDPGQELRRLEKAILNQDPELDLAKVPASVEAEQISAGSSIPRSDRIPETRYARTVDDVHIAYQVLGRGPMDIVLTAWLLNLDVIWKWPRAASVFRRLASFSRLILLDRRGTGLSDHINDEARTMPLEARMDDIRAVMDAAGSNRAVLVGLEDGFALASLFAATHPERTIGLVAYGAAARLMWAPDYPIGWDRKLYEESVADIERAWGTPELARKWMPEVFPNDVGDERTVELFATWMRTGGAPGDVVSWYRVDEQTDVREILPTIAVPSLVVHHVDDQSVPFAHARYIAEHIRGAKLVELPGSQHNWMESEDIAGSIQAFLAELPPEQAEIGRALASVLFIDIVGSTGRADDLRDRVSEVATRYRSLMRRHIGRFRGTEVETARDGVFATFDGPARAVRCAQAIVEAVESLGIEIRAGVHTGECEEIDGKVGGIAVTIGSRISSLASPSEVLVSQTVKDLVAGSGLTFEDAGEYELKGVPDRWHLYRVVG